MLSVGVPRNCPLCRAKLSPDAVALWKKEIVLLEKEQAGLELELENIREEKSRRKTTAATLDMRVETISSSMDEDVRQEKIVAKAKIAIRTVTSEMKATTTRLLKIKTEMKGYDAVVEALRDLDEKMDDLNEDVGSTTQALADIRDRMKSSRAAQMKITKMQRAVDLAKKEAQGFKHVAEAFSRHAIPVQLLTKMREALERRATLIYQQFASGSINIVDVEGARPGVDFALTDEMGVRKYKSLSEGERVMFFLAIRIALSQVINAGKVNRLDFLILDEVCGNLDPYMRENLTRLINSLLRKIFPQILLVSHVSLRDIFTHTLTVTKKAGVSRVQ